MVLRQIPSLKLNHHFFSTHLLNLPLYFISSGLNTSCYYEMLSIKQCVIFLFMECL